MNSFLIIADDFTGSADTGVQLARRGRVVSIVLHGSYIVSSGASCVLDTETRNLPGGEACNAVAGKIKGIDFSRYDCVVKKVDSTLRGNIAEEIAALDEAFHSELVVLMPAFPDMRRTTVDGFQLLNGVRIIQTELAKDPKKPVTADNLPEILGSVYPNKVSHISLDSVRQGQFDFSCCRACAVDAETNGDMLWVVRAAAGTGRKILWVGTAAIVDALLDMAAKPAPALALIASVSEVTARQVRYAERYGAKLVCVDACGLLGGNGAAQYVEQAVELLREGNDVMLVSSATCDRAELEKAFAVGAVLGMGSAEVGSAVQAMMGKLVADVLSQVNVSGLVLSGGDTAIGFFTQSCAREASVTGEVAFGIPMMRLIGGKFDGLKAITKAGAFGQEDAILYALRKLKER